MNKLSKQRVVYLASYLEGYADACEYGIIKEASEALKLLAEKLCGQGFICDGGDNCGSDHK